MRCALHTVGPWPSGKLRILEQPADLNRLTGRFSGVSQGAAGMGAGNGRSKCCG